MIDIANFSSLRECISLVNYSLGPLKDSVFTPTPLSFWPKFQQWPEERVVNASSRTIFLGYFLAKYVGKYLANFDGIEMLTGFFGYFRSWRHELNPPFLWEPTYHRVHCYIFWILVPHLLSPGVAGTEEAIGILMVSPPELGNRWLPISCACWRY